MGHKTKMGGSQASPSRPQPPSALQLRHGSLSEGEGLVLLQRDALQPHAGPTSLEIPAHRSPALRPLHV
ncbi:hypothetical protein Q5P01_007580 [Channa striata]|uniref:Uncharacterized protein n=1 Tax=Channa striata TaxID=64152 RepID=A0AA88STW8_CHASR|nr:hypothetical protein Q5P01_007580 [Channa striata]